MKIPSPENFRPAACGTHPACVCAVVQLGTHEYRDDDDARRERSELLLVFQLDELQADGTPYLISAVYTLSWHASSALRKVGRALLGGDREDAPDTADLLGRPCMVDVEHRVSKGKGRTYAKVHGVSPHYAGAPAVTPLRTLHWMLSDGPFPAEQAVWLPKLFGEDVSAYIARSAEARARTLPARPLPAGPTHHDAF